ncbi:MAG: Ppx/GppA family phosphatase [Deltaproteobacteria bacterium]
MPASSAPLRAAIDIGTNTLLAATGRRRRDGCVDLVADRHRITRLGEGVDRTRVLGEAAMQRALSALEGFVVEARALGAVSVSAVATSAVRDARNRDEFLARARLITGGDVRVISGDEEALLTFRGAAYEVAIARGEPVVVFDVGGGSTEISSGPLDGPPRWHRSIDVGSVRLTERLVRHDPPAPDELAAIDDAITRGLADLPAPEGSFALVGLAATVTTLAAISHGGVLPRLVAISRDTVDRVTESLSRASLGERRATPGLDPGRADVIVAGAAIVRGVMRWCGARSLHASSGGVRVGLLLERSKYD